MKECGDGFEMQISQHAFLVGTCRVKGDHKECEADVRVTWRKVLGGLAEPAEKP